MSHADCGTLEMKVIRENNTSQLAVAISKCIHQIVTDRHRGYQYLQAESPSAEDLFEKLTDGIVLCLLANLVAPNSIRDRLIYKNAGIDIHQKRENINRAFVALKPILGDLHYITVDDVLNKNPVTLDLLWAVVEELVLSHVSLATCPELILLLGDDEEMKYFMELPHKVILLKWLNWHLGNFHERRKRRRLAAQRLEDGNENVKQKTLNIAAGAQMELVSVSNFGSDLQDCRVYAVLLTELFRFLSRPRDPERRLQKLLLSMTNRQNLTTTDNDVNKEGNDDEKLLERARVVLELAAEIGVSVFIEAEDICSGSEQLNLLFLCCIFRACHGIYLDATEDNDNDIDDFDDFHAMDGTMDDLNAISETETESEANAQEVEVEAEVNSSGNSDSAAMNEGNEISGNDGYDGAANKKKELSLSKVKPTSSITTTTAASPADDASITTESGAVSSSSSRATSTFDLLSMEQIDKKLDDLLGPHALSEKLRELELQNQLEVEKDHNSSMLSINSSSGFNSSFSNKHSARPSLSHYASDRSIDMGQFAATATATSNSHKGSGNDSRSSMSSRNSLHSSTLAEVLGGLGGSTDVDPSHSAESLQDRRQAEVFRSWINSRQFDNLQINNLYEDLEDGVGLLKLIDHVQPGIVDWKRVNQPAKSRFQKVENANQAVGYAKRLNLSVVNVGGLDIVDGSKKIVLAITFQLLRKFTLRTLTSLAASEGVKELTEDHVVQWANHKIASYGKTRSITSLRDPALKSGLFLIDLVSSIWPDAINLSKTTQGESYADQVKNARYTLSIARSKGVMVFMHAEDLVEGGNKMLLAFVASLWEAELKEKQTIN